MSDEIRKDFFGREVIVAADRSKRPGAFSEKKKGKQICPFCPGNEKMTQSTIMSLPDDKNWQVRIFPNKFPVLNEKVYKRLSYEKFPLEMSQKNSMAPSMFQKFTSFGRHEIMVETRDHYNEYDDMSTDNLELALVALKKRYEELMKIDGVNYVTIFKNKGEDAGASIRHTHTQIVASPMFPEVISKEMDDGEAFFKESKECGPCMVIEHEAKKKSRVVVNTKDWICIAPFTSVWPYQLRILPKRHFSELSEMNYNELRSLAKVMKKVFGMFSKIFEDMPYNMIYLNFPRSELWHFHIDIFPRLVTHAGFEFFGLNVNITAPEDAAKILRSAGK
ncbi:MAG: galactose-1-phosphate uridylyltransferase [Candidatus Aenigmarchaeota archaeon]|nr:galactose-1-phosphate uridylyltransferase [Candidatus Aenigmarchaeota archaeon]